MYLAYYGLEREPFHITPDPEFLFLSPSHKEAFAAVVYGVEQRKGFVALMGEVGTGKTTILRAYLKRIERSAIRPIYLFNPDLSFEELLRLILRETEGAVPEEPSAALMDRLQWRLIEEYKASRNVVLIIDEAQNMPVETLEKLRMLSNLETSRDKLLQIVLVGQPELQTKLELHQLRQLNQRIAVRANLRPLNKAESFEYIQYRLTQAGCLRDDVFSRDALRRIVAASHGNPRILNILCDNALIAGFGGEEETVSGKTVRQVIADTAMHRRRPTLRWAAIAAGILVAAGLSAVFLSGGWGSENQAVPGNHLQIAHADIGEAMPAATPGPQPAAAPVAPAPNEPAPVSTPAMPETTPAAPVAPTPAPTPEPVAAAAAAPVADTPAPEPTPAPEHLSAALKKMQELTAGKDNVPDAAVERAVAERAAQAAEEPVTPPVLDGPAADAPKPEPAAAAEPAVATPKAEPEVAQTVAEAAPAAKPEEVKTAAVAAPTPEPEAVEAPVAPTPVSPTPISEPAPAAPVAAPAAETVSAEAPASSAAAESLSGSEKTFTRHVVKGDCLTRLVEEVYGHVSPAMIEVVRSRNPQVLNADVIWFGDELVFPEEVQDERGAVYKAVAPEQTLSGE